MAAKRPIHAQIALSIMMVTAVLIIPTIDKNTEYWNERQKYQNLLENAVNENMSQEYVNHLKDLVADYDLKGLFSAVTLFSVILTAFIAIIGVMLFYGKEIIFSKRKKVRIGSKQLALVNQLALFFLLFSILLLAATVHYAVAAALAVIAISGVVFVLYYTKYNKKR